MTKLPILLAIPLLMFASCNNQENKESSKSSRYSAQTFSVAGGMAVITQITDNETNKVYFYELSDKKGLTLKNTIDLTQCGEDNIPFIKSKDDSSTKSK